MTRQWGVAERMFEGPGYRWFSESVCEARVSPSHELVSSIGLREPDDIDEDEPMVHSSASSTAAPGLANS